MYPKTIHEIYLFNISDIYYLSLIFILRKNTSIFLLLNHLQPILFKLSPYFGNIIIVQVKAFSQLNSLVQSLFMICLVRCKFNDCKSIPFFVGFDFPISDLKLHLSNVLPRYGFIFSIFNTSNIKINCIGIFISHLNAIVPS